MLGYFFLIECIDWPKHRHLPFQSYGYKNCTLQRVQKQTEKSVPQILDSYLYAVKFTDTEKGIMPPLNALPGLGANAAMSIVEARKDGEFLSIEDLQIRGKAGSSVIEILRIHGALQGLTETNQISMF